MKQVDRIKVSRPTGRRLHNVLAVDRECSYKDCKEVATVTINRNEVPKYRCHKHVNPPRIRTRGKDQLQILKSLGLI